MKTLKLRLGRRPGVRLLHERWRQEVAQVGLGACSMRQAKQQGRPASDLFQKDYKLPTTIAQSVQRGNLTTNALQLDHTLYEHTCPALLIFSISMPTS